MNKIRITDYFNNYKVKEQMEHDLKIMMKHLKLVSPFKKYETKTYYDETSKEYKCEVYDVTKLRIFEITYEDGEKCLVEVNGNDRKVTTHFVIQNMKNKTTDSKQIIEIKNVKNGKVVGIAKIDHIGVRIINE